MPQVSAKRWAAVVESFNFNERIEFNEGDIGLGNGIQIVEGANEHPTTLDQIKRYGGSTSPSIRWPEEDAATDDDSDRFERMENLVKKAMERVSKGQSRQAGQ